MAYVALYWLQRCFHVIFTPNKATYLSCSTNTNRSSMEWRKILKPSLKLGSKAISINCCAQHWMHSFDMDSSQNRIFRTYLFSWMTCKKLKTPFFIHWFFRNGMPEHLLLRDMESFRIINELANEPVEFSSVEKSSQVGAYLMYPRDKGWLVRKLCYF